MYKLKDTGLAFKISAVVLAIVLLLISFKAFAVI